MDILARLKCISVSRLLGFALISLPRKFIICLSVPDSCTVVFKGINDDSLFLSSPHQCWTPLPCSAKEAAPMHLSASACSLDYSARHGALTLSNMR